MNSSVAIPADEGWLGLRLNCVPVYRVRLGLLRLESWRRDNWGSFVTSGGRSGMRSRSRRKGVLQILVSRGISRGYNFFRPGRQIWRES